MPTSMTFDINCKNGETIIEYKFNGSNKKEDGGDAIRSDYLVIEDRNYPDAAGDILAWSESDVENSHYLVHDVEGGLTNIYLDYDYMYL